MLKIARFFLRVGRLVDLQYISHSLFTVGCANGAMQSTSIIRANTLLGDVANKIYVEPSFTSGL